MTEQELRDAIVKEAISWEFTPYHPPYARVKGVGVDCAQLPLAVYHACGYIPELNPQYSGQWMNHRDEELYIDEIRKWSREIEPNEALPGDLLIWKFGRTFSHSGIIISPGVVLHAWLKAGKVTRSDIGSEEELLTRPVKAFTVFAKDGRPLRPKPTKGKK